MATRWIKQRDQCSCGPVAILNILKWLGRDVTYSKDFQHWKERCCCDRTGTPLFGFVDALKSIEGIGVQPRTVPSVEVIDKAICEGKAVAMKSAALFDGELNGHFFIITDRTDKSFYCVNIYGGHRWWGKESFEDRWLQHHLYYCCECGVAPYAWIVRKK